MTTPPEVPAKSSFAGSSIPAWLRLTLPAIVGVALDLSIKSYSFPDGVDPNSEINGLHPFAPGKVLIPHILDFQTRVNHGAVFGLGQGFGFLFVLFSFAAAAMILWVFARFAAINGSCTWPWKLDHRRRPGQSL